MHINKYQCLSSIRYLLWDRKRSLVYGADPGTPREKTWNRSKAGRRGSNRSRREGTQVFCCGKEPAEGQYDYAEGQRWDDVFSLQEGCSYARTGVLINEEDVSAKYAMEIEREEAGNLIRWQLRNEDGQRTWVNRQMQPVRHFPQLLDLKLLHAFNGVCRNHTSFLLISFLKWTIDFPASA